MGTDHTVRPADVLRTFKHPRHIKGEPVALFGFTVLCCTFDDETKWVELVYKPRRCDAHIVPPIVRTPSSGVFRDPTAALSGSSCASSRYFSSIPCAGVLVNSVKLPNLWSSNDVDDSAVENDDDDVGSDSDCRLLLAREQQHRYDTYFPMRTQDRSTATSHRTGANATAMQAVDTRAATTVINI